MLLLTGRLPEVDWLVSTAGELASAFGTLAVSAVLFNSCVTLPGVLVDDELTDGLDDGVVNAVTDALLADVNALVVTTIGMTVVGSPLLPVTIGELVTTSTLGRSVGLDVAAAVIELLPAAGRLLFVVVIAVGTAGELLEFELVAAGAIVELPLSGSFLIKSLLGSGVSEDIVHFCRPVVEFLRLFSDFDRLRFQIKRDRFRF